MTGTIKVQFSARNVTYALELKRNITIIKDEGATGKSILCKLIGDWIRLHTTPEGRYFSYSATHNMEPRLLTLETIRDRGYELWKEPQIVFVDEDWHVAETREFASVVANSPHYFVIISRDLKHLQGLTFSVDSIVSLTGIRYKTLIPWVNSPTGKAKNIKRIGNLFSLDSRSKRITPDKIVIEDSNTGYQFFSHIAGSDCIPSGGIINDVPQGGKSKIVNMMSKQCKSTVKPVIAIADGAAFGAEFEFAVLNSLFTDNAYYYLYESFEWLLLHTPTLYSNSKVKSLVDNPRVESTKYLSWERYFTKLLETCSRGIRGFEYTKSTLPSGYLQPAVVQALLARMPEISFDKWLNKPEILSFEGYTYEFKSLEACLALFRRNASKMRCAKGYYMMNKTPAVVFYSPSERKIYYTRSELKGLSGFRGVRLTKEQVSTIFKG